MNFDVGREYDFIDLELGHNFHENTKDKIDFSMITTGYYGKCYKISTNLYNPVSPGEYYGIEISFFKELITFNDIPPVKFFFTSEQNAFGITANEWRDGKVLELTKRPCTKTNISIKPIKYVYSKSKSNCRDKSYYECYEKQLFANFYGDCNYKCSISKNKSRKFNSTTY